jgi:septum formation protein
VTLPTRPSIVLASASPRRKELLAQAGTLFEICPADIPENARPGETPVAFAERMAVEKARVVRKTRPERIILAADTVVALGREILGKPRDAEDARRMLRVLSGKSHEVTTGVCVCGPGFEDVGSETTTVCFSEIPDEEIFDYVASGEPLDKAGGYAIQGGACDFVEAVGGRVDTVIGLDVSLALRLLAQAGYPMPLPSAADVSLVARTVRRPLSPLRTAGRV